MHHRNERPLPCRLHLYHRYRTYRTDDGSRWDECKGCRKYRPTRPICIGPSF